MVYSSLEFAYISSMMTGGQGCSASFTVEWFPLREGGNLLPPSPLIPTDCAAEPSQRGKWVRRVLHGEQPGQAAVGPGNLALLPPPTSRQLRPFHQSSQEVAAPLLPRAVPVD